MTDAEWIANQCVASIKFGSGTWLTDTTDPLLGKGIYRGASDPGIALYEHGFTYSVSDPLTVLYAEIEEVEPLGLRELMMANHKPQELVEFWVSAGTGRHAIRLPLYQYSTTFSILNGLVLRRAHG